VAARWREGEGPERRHPLARRAPTRTSVSAWWWSLGPGVAGAAPARVGRGATGVASVGSGRCGPGPSVAGAAARVEAMRLREVGERKGMPGYYTRLCSSGRHINRRT
jgi:hypothetical protein